MTRERPSDDRPSRAEVQQRISSLYDQAENATGNFNATRAMSKSARTRRGSAGWSGSGGSDPALDRVARKWFDVGRAQLGPTMPAVLPPDRMPNPANSPAAAPGRRPEDVREALGLEAGRAPRPELTAGPAGPVPELPAAVRDTTPPPELPAAPTATVAPSPVAELTARSMEPPAAGTAGPVPTGSMEVLPNRTMQPPPTGTMGALPADIMQAPPTGSMEALPVGIMQPPPTGTTGALPADIMQAPPTGSMGALPISVMQPPPTGTMEALPADIMQAPPTSSMGALPIGIMQPPPTGTIGSPPNVTTGVLPTGTMEAPTTGTMGVLPIGTMQPPPTGGMQAPTTGSTQALSAGALEASATGAMDVLSIGSPSTATPPAGPVAGFAGVAEAGREVVGGAAVSVARHRQAAVRRPAKERTRNKLARAGEMLSRHAAQQSAPPPAAVGARPAEEPRPAPQPEATQWQRHATGLFDTTPPLDGNSLFDASQAGGPGAAGEPGAATGPDPATGPGVGVGVGDSPVSAYERKAAKALAFARAQIGKPCVWGATGPGSYDCSSLTQAAWRAAGVALPRTTHEQVGSGAAIELAELEPGDLIFFYGEVSHVGLYAGNGTMVHAPSPGASISEESIFFAGPRAIHSAIRPA
ncbi:C40 family peptidase [Streptomyces sp. CoT10]|uniref:C40 family peptidase n=1 Tax=Streptomyces sp. CoT10 TaxID=2875762 RepID=UPI001CD20CCE|nr:C40 family peptidase [Streptomyces sp. CoT10]